MNKVYNFSAGPAALPRAVLERLKIELPEFRDAKASVMEISHRGIDFMTLAKKAEQDLRDLMSIPDNYKVLFLQGGASQQFSMVPINLLRGKKIANNVSAMVVPGSGLVKEQAEQEGLDKIFVNSGFEWREPGCSMCLAMNADKLKPEERCASTSNRNFEGRQGRGGRTHLVSPGMAAAAAISGNLDDVRKYRY